MYKYKLTIIWHLRYTYSTCTCTCISYDITLHDDDVIKLHDVKHFVDCVQPLTSSNLEVKLPSASALKPKSSIPFTQKKPLAHVHVHDKENNALNANMVAIE